MGPRAVWAVRLLVVGGAVLAVAAGVLAFVEFSSPQLGRALLDRAGAAAGARLEAAEFRLSVLRGLALRDVRASGTYAGGRYELTLARLVFEHRLLPLFAGRLTVDRIRLDRPRVVLIEGAGASARAGGPPVATPVAGPVALHVVEAVIEDGQIELRARAGAPTAIRGFDLRLRDLAVGPGEGSALARLSGRGDVHVDEIATAATRARDVQGALRLSAGRLEADGLRFETDEGRFQARWSADLTRLPFSYAMGLDGRPIDVNALAGATGGGGFGPAHLTLEGRGVGPEPEGLSGTGRLRLEAGTLPSTPLLAAIERAVGRSGVVGAPYQATDTPFRIERGRVFVDGFRIQSAGVALEASGWSSLEGPLELSVAVRTPRESVRIPEVPPAVLDALTGQDGWVRIPLRVTGTRAAPRVVPDRAVLMADARQAGAKALAGKAAEKLKGLLRR